MILEGIFVVFWIIIWELKNFNSILPPKRRRPLTKRRKERPKREVKDARSLPPAGILVHA